MTILVNFAQAKKSCQFHALTCKIFHFFFFFYSFKFCSNRNYDNGSTSGTNGTTTNEYSHNNPLAHLSESVNAIDPLNAMEKTLNEVYKKKTFSLFISSIYNTFLHLVHSKKEFFFLLLFSLFTNVILIVIIGKWKTCVYFTYTFI